MFHSSLRRLREATYLGVLLSLSAISLSVVALGQYAAKMS